MLKRTKHYTLCYSLADENKNIFMLQTYFVYRIERLINILTLKCVCMTSSPQNFGSVIYLVLTYLIVMELYEDNHSLDNHKFPLIETLF